MRSRLMLWIVATVAIVAATMAARLLLNFLHATAPGMDAAYYPPAAKSDRVRATNVDRDRHCLCRLGLGSVEAVGQGTFHIALR